MCLPSRVGVRLRLVDSIRQDVRYAIRAFRRSPGFTFVAVLVLALGISANTTIFSLVNAVLIRPLPVPDAQNLTFLSAVFARAPNSPAGVPHRTFEQLAQHPDIFSGLAGFYGDGAKIGTGLSASSVRGERVTSNYFDVLRVKAALGRTFAAFDDVPGATPIVVVSDQFWRKRMGANPNVIGTTIDLRSSMSSSDDTYLRHHRAYTVVGVMPPGFNGVWSDVWVPAEYWVPLRQRVSDLVEAEAETGPGEHSAAAVERRLNQGGIMLVGRLKPGVTDAALRTVVRSAEQDMPETPWATAQGVRREKRSIVFASAFGGRLPFDQTGKVVPVRLALALMLVSVMVMLIAATNLAGILMARGVARRAEVGVRLALGASGARVARQMLTESLLLSLAGAIAALGLSRMLIDLFMAYMPGRIGAFAQSSLTLISLDVPIDARVLVFTMALGIGTGLLVGIAPAVQALRTDIMATLMGSSHALPAAGRSRVRRWIVVPQICLSLVLLLAAGVLVQALLRAELADRGFEPNGVIYADVATPQRYFAGMTPEQRRAEDARRKAVYMQLLEQVRAIPGVGQAALVTKSAWNGRDKVSVVTRDSHGDGQNRWVSAAQVSSGYFETMGIPIVRGRAFDARDRDTTTPVAIVCEGLGQMLWADKDPVGEYIANHDPSGSAAAPSWLLVVGVAKDVKVPGSEDRTTPFMYLPVEQRPRIFGTSLVVRGRGGPRELLKTMSEGIVAAHPEAEIPRARTMDEEIAEVLYPRRLGAAVLALSGLFGLLLSTVGLYGVVSYSAAQRLREMGIRAALGAERRDIFALLLRDALLTLGIAVGCGVALGFAAVRVVSSIVVALPAMDVVTLVTVPALLSAVIFAACLLPARRAARVNPIEVLRGL